MKKIENAILVAAFLLFTLVLHFTSSNDFTQDLGRHLKLGEMIVQTKTIPSQNLFSYTNPNFPFTNHHWLSEVFFYILSHSFGLSSLLLLKVSIIVAAVFIVVLIGLKTRNYLTAIVSALIFSPLLLDRSDIRPEIFGYLFFSILLFLMMLYPHYKRGLLFIPLIMILWVNIHISFIFGVYVLGIFFIKLILIHKKSLLTIHKNILFLFLISFASLFINPHGLSGVLYPLNIFSNYGYTIAENQNLFFLNSMTFNLLIKYYFFLSPLIIISILLLISKLEVVAALILSTFYLAAFVQIRHMPFFALSAIPAVALALRTIQSFIKVHSSYQKGVKVALSTILIILSLLFVNNFYFKTFDKDRQFGLQVSEDYKSATDFVKKYSLPGNIFNNFDIGGYLIYQLYPRYKVFVDNRPEAYPSDFFKNIYISLQVNRGLRNQVFDHYDINTVIFSHTDQTQWGKAFLADIYKDSSWKIVYFDPVVVIFTRSNKLKDLRDNEAYFANLIDRESNYLNLLFLSQTLSLFGEASLSNESFNKAKNINPSSCAIKKSVYLQQQNLPDLFQNNDVRRNSWHCFL